MTRSPLSPPRLACLVGAAVLLLAAAAGAQRGSVNPCNTPDPGWGVYDRWSRAPSIGQMIAPGRGGLTRSGGFDLIVHFHGHEPIRKEFVKEAKGIVLVGIDLGIGSGPYSRAFASPAAFKRLLESVEAEMARRSGRKKTHVRRLGLSAWSAGYGAIAEILRQPAGKKVDVLILLDSVHTGYVDAEAKTLKTAQLDPFVAFARRAVRGRDFMFQSYSSIVPPGYASTQEVARYVIGKLGGKPRRARRNDVLGLRLFERYDRGGYHARGYRGGDKPDHCGHLGLMKDVLKVHVKPRWRTPRGYRGRARSADPSRPDQGIVHVVERGQTLSGIAKRYRTTVRAIRKANGLKKSKPIRVGQELVIPETKKRARAGQGSAPRRLGPGERLHVVERGDTLTGIAKKYGTTVRAIREKNGVRKGGRPIQVGQELVIPKAERKKPKKPKPATSRPLRRGERAHKVARGETLIGIAKRYKITVAALRKANGLTKGGRPIRAGQTLIIPPAKR